MVENGVCNDESNNAECNFDGGDCITTTMSASTTTISTLSTTHDPGNCIPYSEQKQVSFSNMSWFVTIPRGQFSEFFSYLLFRL